MMIVIKLESQLIAAVSAGSNFTAVITVLSLQGEAGQPGVPGESVGV